MVVVEKAEEKWLHGLRALFLVIVFAASQLPATMAPPEL